MGRERPEEVVSLSARLKLALLLAPALLVLGTLFVGGLVAAFVQSLGYLPAVGMTEINLDAYRQVLESPWFLDSLALTVYVAGISTLVATVLGVLTALALRHAPGSIGSLLLQVPLTIPHLLAAVGMAFVVGQTGLGARLAAALGLVGAPEAFPALLYDKYSVGIILTYVWKEVPFIALVVLAGLRGVASELEDVARTLGANAWQRFRGVVFPVIAPGIVAASLVVFAFSFGAVEVPYLLGRDYPTVLAVTAYDEYRSVDLADRPLAMAINVLMTLVTAVFAACYLRVARRWGRG